MGARDGRHWFMNQGRAVFSQLISLVPDREFRRCVERCRGDIRLRGFSCWDQYLAMAFAQLTYRESLRDIEACLLSMQGKLYHMGFRGKVARSTLADANESHDWRIFARRSDNIHHLLACCSLSRSCGDMPFRMSLFGIAPLLSRTVMPKIALVSTCSDSETRAAMKDTRHSEEQIIAILNQGLAGLTNLGVTSTARLTEQTGYRWKAKYGGVDSSEAKRLEATESREPETEARGGGTDVR